MKPHHWSQGLFLLAMAALIAALIPACGGGGGGAGAAPQTVVDHKIYVSTTGPSVPIAASASNYVVRSITFTPTSADDVPLYVMVSGSYTATTGALWGIALEILDAGGLSINQGGYSVALPTTTGVPVPFSLRQSMMNMTTQDVFFAPSVPSTSYTVRLVVTTNSSWSGQFDSTQFKIITAENVTVVSPSSNISG